MIVNINEINRPEKEITLDIENDGLYHVSIKNIKTNEEKDINFSSLFLFNTFLVEFNISLFDDIYMKIQSELFLEKRVILEFNEEDFTYIKERTSKTKYVERD